MSSTFRTAADLSRRLLLWWGDELADLVPKALRRWAAREGKRTVLALEDGRLVQYREGRRGLVRQGETELDTAEAGPDASGLGRRGGQVGIRLPQSACLVRRLELPAAARRDFAKILQLDLERTTPFRGEDVYSDHFIEDGKVGGGKIAVRQVLVKRSILDPVLQQLATRGIAVSFADCWEESGESALPVNLLKSAEAASASGGRRMRPALVLALFALALASSAVMIGLGKYEAALESVSAEAELARAKALAVRRSLSGAEAALVEIADLRRMKAERPTIISVLDELTRLLPDEAWVRYLKIDGDALNVTIVAPSAGEMMPLLGQSALFGAASLTAPVTYDEAGKNERATVRMLLRPAAAKVESARADGSRG
jgi:general secretion pathway protein L